MKIKKRLLIAFLPVFSAVMVNAQEKETATEDNPILWSYVNQDSELKNYSLKQCKPGVLCQIAIRVRAWNKNVAGYKIFGECIGLPHKENISNLWVWMSRNLPDKPENADITYKEVSNDYTQDKYESNTKQFFKFDEPYFFANEDIYIGYSFVLSPESSGGYPLIFATEGNLSEGNTHFAGIANNWANFSFEENVPFAYVVTSLKDCDASDYIAGDVNVDNAVNVTDITRTVGYILDGNSEKMITIAADVNKDGNINVTDVEKITDIVLSKQVSETNAEHNNEALLLTENDGTMSLSLSSASAYRAFQMDLSVPEGSKISDIMLNDEIKSSHILSYRCIDNGKYRVMVRSNDGSCFYGTELLNIKSTSSNLSISNIIFVTEDTAEKRFSNVFSGNVTGIKEINNDGCNAPIYNVNGVRIDSESAVKGVYIINGKKVIK